MGPSIVRRHPFPNLGIPGLIKKYGADLGEWGQINNYHSLDEPETIVAWISGILVECFAKDSKTRPSSSVVQKNSRKLVHALQVINDDAIRYSTESLPNQICAVKTSVLLQEDGKPQAKILIQSIIDDRKQMLSFKDIKLAIRAFDKTVSSPYEMLDNARINLSNHDWRAAVLNCATAIEISLKRLIIEYLDTNTVPEHVKAYVLKQADGYSKLVDCFKKLAIQLNGLPNMKEQVMDVRNRVIHGGYEPSSQESYQAYNCTKTVLRTLNVPMFE